MTQSSYKKNRQRLENLMQQAGITSLQELSRLSGVCQWQLIRLAYGLMPKMSVGIILKLSHTLQVSVDELLTQFCPDELVAQTLKFSPSQDFPQLAHLQQEYQLLQEKLNQERESLQQEFQRLQAQMERQKQDLTQEWISSSLQQLESWLIQWPTAAVAAQKNPKLPALKLLPLIKPIAGLLKQWGVEAIAAVGEQVSYDPQLHQLLEGQAEVGDLVRVRYVGYRQGEKLLYRAKVSPIAPVNQAPATKVPANHHQFRQPLTVSEPTVFDPPTQ
jgi:molecular chaperone GrpE (heat shock protein)